MQWPDNWLHRWTRTKGGAHDDSASHRAAVDRPRPSGACQQQRLLDLRRRGSEPLPVPHPSRYVELDCRRSQRNRLPPSSRALGPCRGVLRRRGDRHHVVHHDQRHRHRNSPVCDGPDRASRSAGGSLRYPSLVRRRTRHFGKAPCRGRVCYFFERARKAATRSLNSGVENEVYSTASAYSSTPWAALDRCMFIATLLARSACGGSAASRSPMPSASPSTTSSPAPLVTRGGFSAAPPVLRPPSGTPSLPFIPPITTASIAAPRSPASNPTG